MIGIMPYSERRIKMNIKILIDTSADLPNEIIEKYDLGVVPFMSVFGDKSYKTGIDITNAEFYDMLDQADQIPTTSQTPPADMYEIFKKATDEYDAVIYYTISSKASGQNHTAHLMREDLVDENPDAKLYIVDTMNFSVYIGQTVIKAAELAKEGKTPEEIISFSEEFLKTWDCRLIVDDLTYLEKGGRINKTTAFVGSLLDIKPMLGIRDGLVASLDKLRGKKKIVDKFIAKIEEDELFNTDNPEFAVIHSDPDKGEEAKSKLEEKYGKGTVTLYTEFGPIVGTHVGRGALGILYKLKTN